MSNVVLERGVVKVLQRLPSHIAQKMLEWVDAVEHEGLEEVRKVPGYHDEPLRGQRAGQRSIRLNRAYRAIYVVTTAGKIEIVRVTEVSKHEY